MSYFDHLAGHVRLAVLRALDEGPHKICNDGLLTDEVRRVGCPVTRDQLRGHLAWLAEQGLVELEDRPRAGQRPLKVATLTERGEDVAAGRVRVEGVQRPSPR